MQTTISHLHFPFALAYIKNREDAEMNSSLLKVLINSPASIFITLVSTWVIYSVILSTIRITRQAKYEAQFTEHVENLLRENNNAQLEAVPLTFPRLGEENLLTLCTRYRSKCTPGYYKYIEDLRYHNPPSVQTHLLRFRWMAVEEDSEASMLTRMIRCSHDRAVIESGDGRSAYVLRRDKKRGLVSGQYFTFYIYSKFHHNQEAVQPAGGVELTPVAEQSANRSQRPPVK